MEDVSAIAGTLSFVLNAAKDVATVVARRNQHGCSVGRGSRHGSLCDISVSAYQETVDRLLNRLTALSQTGSWKFP